MYELPSPFETDGAFSRFGGAEAGGSGTAEAAMATCDAKLAQEIVDVAAVSADRLLKRMALGVIQQGTDVLKLYLRQEAKAARIVARATSLEVQSGEDLIAAHRRLAEEPACPPPLSPPPPPPPLLPGESLASGTEFILRISGAGRRRRRALSAVGLSTVRSAVIEAMNLWGGHQHHCRPSLGERPRRRPFQGHHHTRRRDLGGRLPQEAKGDLPLGRV